jgi:acyl-coenzyme A thioesterase PaaI-like protein
LSVSQGSRSNEGRVGVGAENGHDSCLLCGRRNPWSFELTFRATVDGGVQATFHSHAGLQGYDHLLHGGVISALLDAAMTHCLFHRGVRAVTADLRVRFRRPVSFDAVINLRANVIAAKPRLYRLRAEALVDGGVVAWGEGKFIPRRKTRPITGLARSDEEKGLPVVVGGNRNTEPLQDRRGEIEDVGIPPRSPVAKEHPV